VLVEEPTLPSPLPPPLISPLPSPAEREIKLTRWQRFVAWIKRLYVR
jgi:hypothetical protein